MTALPRTVLEEVGRKISPRKTATYREVRNQFAKHGYGQNKIDKWIEYYQNCEIITLNTEDNTVTCVLW